MTGATGNIYCGLDEFEMMAFLIHLIRPKDLFCDVGSNVGLYSILSASTGIECHSFEPIKKTFMALLENIQINHYEDLIHAENIAISDESGEILMTDDLDTYNHALSSATESGSSVKVICKHLDQIIDRALTLIKIDTEGHESEVISGMGELIKMDELKAMIVEINDLKTKDVIVGMGFNPYRYDPFKRELTKMSSEGFQKGNCIFIRDYEFVMSRINHSPKHVVHGVSF